MNFPCSIFAQALLWPFPSIVEKGGFVGGVPSDWKKCFWLFFYNCCFHFNLITDYVIVCYPVFYCFNPDGVHETVEFVFEVIINFSIFLS